MTDLTASQSKYKSPDKYQLESLTSSSPFDINNFNKSYFENKASAIHGSETKGIFKRLANSLTNDLAYPKTLTYTEQSGVMHELRKAIGGSHIIQNQADIEKYNTKSLFGHKTWTHGDVFTTSEIGTAIVGGASLLKNIPKAISVKNASNNIQELNSYPKTGTLLEKGERLKIYSQKLKESPASNNSQEAFNLLDKIMTEVEDAYSGVKKIKNPSLKYEGRMYAPRADYTEKLPDGSIEAATAGNIIKLSKSGDIEFFLKNKDGSAGNRVFFKEGVKDEQ